MNTPERLSALENAIKLDERLSALENRIGGDDTRPWWTKTGLITVLVAILAAVPPVTTAVSGLLKGWREREHQREVSRQTRRDKYIDKALEEKLDPKTRQLVFDYLATDFKGDPLEDWARRKLAEADELVRVEQELLDAKGKLAATEVAVAEKDSRIAELDGALKSAIETRDAADELTKQQLEERDERVKYLRAELDDERSAKNKLGSDLDEAQRRIRELDWQVQTTLEPYRDTVQIEPDMDNCRAALDGLCKKLGTGIREVNWYLKWSVYECDGRCWNGRRVELTPIVRDLSKG